MKNLLLFLLLACTTFASANTIIRVPKDATHKFGLVVVLRDGFKAGEPFILFNHGIGERGSGSYADLGRLETWGGIQYMWEATDVFGFNAVAVQTSSNYQYGEIQYAIQYVIDSLKGDPNRIGTINNSLGGYGFAQQSGVDPSLPTKFCAIAQVVMGPGEVLATAKNIADAKRPVWFFSSADDSVVSVSKTDTLYNRVKRLGGNAWYTRWIKGGHGVLSRVVGSYYKLPNNWKMAICESGYTISATILCGPPQSVYTWILSNKVSQPAIPPDVIVPTLPPVSSPVVLPKKLIKTIEFYSDSTFAEKAAP
jgi:predicted esterase